MAARVTSSAGGSICWKCKNAYAHKCLWIKDMKKVWTSADMRKVSVGTKKSPKTMDVYTVTECKYFEPDPQKRKRRKLEE